MVLEFYYDLLSQPCRAVWLFLKAAGIPFEPHVMSLLKREQYNPEFMKKNPFKKVPLITDDGLVLAESAAIMRYIAVKYEAAEHWYPRSDPRQAAKIDEFLHWQHLNIRQHTLAIFIDTIRTRMGVGERFPKKPLDVEKVTAAKAELDKTVKHIDEYFLAGKPFIGGDDVSVADLSGVSELVHLRGVGEEGCYTSNPNVNAWMKRVEHRLEPYFDEALVSLNALAAAYTAAGQTKEV